MSLVELGFRALVTSGSHNANKSLQAPKGADSLTDIATTWCRVAMGEAWEESITGPGASVTESVRLEFKRVS